MDTFLQLWGGGFYLANKVCFSLSETRAAERSHRLKLLAWSAYIIGVPAWVILLTGKHDWIAASIEAGGLPAMLLGFYRTWKKQTAHRHVETAVRLATFLAIVFGLAISLLHYGGITSLSQILEIGVTLGFLMGSYLMAQHSRNGYLCFMLMNLSMAALMFMQDKDILMAQQLVSLCFVIYGYLQSGRSRAG